MSNGAVVWLMPKVQTAIRLSADYKIPPLMGFLDQINHLVNFVAPALAVALVLALVGPIFMPKRPRAQVFPAQVAINFVAGAVALLLGLWFFGHDGKMATYAAMLVFCTVAQAASGRWGK
jgi:hypothetical protein